MDLECYPRKFSTYPVGNVGNEKIINYMRGEYVCLFIKAQYSLIIKKKTQIMYKVLLITCLVHISPFIEW